MKSVLITGASSGIGRATALELAADSPSRFFLIGRNEERLSSLHRQLIEAGSESHTFICNVSSATEVERTYQSIISDHQKIDIAFLNAGVGRFGSIEDLTEEDYDLQFNTNVKGVFLWIRLLVAIMKQSKSGQIIVTSSNLGLETSPRASLYAATKFAVEAIVGSVRKELKGTGVKIATVNPGAVDTPWFDGKKVDRSKMLDVNDVVNAVKLIVNQGRRSDIRRVHLTPP